MPHLPYIIGYNDTKIIVCFIVLNTLYLHQSCVMHKVLNEQPSQHQLIYPMKLRDPVLPTFVKSLYTSHHSYLDVQCVSYQVVKMRTLRLLPILSTSLHNMAQHKYQCHEPQVCHSLLQHITNNCLLKIIIIKVHCVQQGSTKWKTTFIALEIQMWERNN